MKVSSLEAILRALTEADTRYLIVGGLAVAAHGCWSTAVTDRTPPKPPHADEAWRAHNVEQLLYFRSLSLREKLEAVEGMADVVRLLERVRAKVK